MAEIEVTIPTVPYGNVKVRGASAREVLAVLQDEDFGEVLGARFFEHTVEATGATESDEEALDEGEALEALKTALGATEAPVTVSQGSTGDAKAAFLQKFGKDGK